MKIYQAAERAHYDHCSMTRREWSWIEKKRNRLPDRYIGVTTRGCYELNKTGEIVKEYVPTLDDLMANDWVITNCPGFRFRAEKEG